MTRIIWRRYAFQRMDQIVREHPAWAPAIGEALRLVTRELTSDPSSVGESRERSYRVVTEAPLSFYFRPAPEEEAVYIVNVVFYCRE
jgi:hypothetical protein